MTSNLSRLKCLWGVTTGLTLVAALIGVIKPSIYDTIMNPDFVPAAYAQDLLTVVLCAVLLVLIFTTREGQFRRQVAIMGVVASFWYLYGIFVIERMYNWWYFLYLAIFALSFWSTIYAVATLRREEVGRVNLPNAMRHASAWFSVLIAVIFMLLWTLQLVPLLRDRNKIEFLYSIYILDLGFVMPAFLITAVMALRRQPLGMLLAPVVFIMGIFVIFPLGLGEVAKPFYGMSMNVGSMVSSFVLSGAFVLFTVLHLRALRMDAGRK